MVIPPVSSIQPVATTGTVDKVGATGGSSNGFLDGLNEVQASLDNADKLQHIVAFICLGACAALSLPAGRSHLLAAGLGMLAFGVFIELVQMHIPQRSADWQDVVADALGVTLAVVLFPLIRRASARVIDAV